MHTERGNAGKSYATRSMWALVGAKGKFQGDYAAQEFSAHGPEQFLVNLIYVLLETVKGIQRNVR